MLLVGYLKRNPTSQTHVTSHTYFYNAHFNIIPAHIYANICQLVPFGMLFIDCTFPTLFSFFFGGGGA